MAWLVVGSAWSKASAAISQRLSGVSALPSGSSSTEPSFWNTSASLANQPPVVGQCYVHGMMYTGGAYDDVRLGACDDVGFGAHGNNKEICGEQQ